MPGYNSARTLERVYKQIPNKKNLKVILCDDGSKDNTVAISKKLDIETIVHKKNLGYGENQKTCYAKALKIGADYVIMPHFLGGEYASALVNKHKFNTQKFKHEREKHQKDLEIRTQAGHEHPNVSKNRG